MSLPAQVSDSQASLNRFIKKCAVFAVACIAAASGISLGIVIDAVNHLNSNSRANHSIFTNTNTEVGCEKNAFNQVLEELFHEKPITAPPTC